MKKIAVIMLALCLLSISCHLAKSVENAVNSEDAISTEDALRLKDAIALYENEEAENWDGRRIVEIIEDLVSKGINTTTGRDNNSLHYASEYGYIEIVTALITAGADLEARRDHTEYETALVLAAANGHTKAVRALIEAGANIEKKVSASKTALIFAASRGHTETVKALVEAGANIEAKDDDDTTVAIFAAGSGQLETLMFLIEAGADIEVKNKYGKTVLHSAASRGHTETVAFLIEAGADLEAKTQVGFSTVYTPLIQAAEKGHTETVKVLLEAGANIEGKSDDGPTALMEAAYNGQSETVTFLLEAGANLEVKINDNKTVLMYAAGGGETDTIKILVEAGANIEAQDDYGYTALMNAAQSGRTETVKALIEAGADLDFQDDYDWSTALMLSIVNENPTIETVIALIEGGADLDIQDESGYTALMNAWVPEIATPLINGGASLDIQNNYGTTALIRAARYERTEIVKALIEAGANINIQDDDGYNALLYATEEGHREIVNLLTNAGSQTAIKTTINTTRPSIDYRHVIFGNNYQNIQKIDANAFFAQYPKIKETYSAGGYYEYVDSSYTLSETNYDHVYEQVIGENTFYRVLLSYGELTEADFDDWSEVRFTQYVFLKKSDTDLLQLGESYEFGQRDALKQYESSVRYNGLEIIERNNQVIGIMKYSLFYDYHWGGMDGPGRTVKYNTAFYYVWADIMQSESELLPTISHFTFIEKPSIKITSTEPLSDNRRPFMYTIQNAFDGNPATSFVEYTKDNLMSIHFEFPNEHTFTDVAIINGYAQDESMYSSNNRGKTISFPETSTDYKNIFSLDGNTLAHQEFTLENPITQSSASIDVTEIYEGTKYTDTCLAEFDIFIEGDGWLFGLE